jgi:hypothetical protein
LLDIKKYARNGIKQWFAIKIRYAMI